MDFPHITDEFSCRLSATGIFSLVTLAARAGTSLVQTTRESHDYLELTFGIWFLCWGEAEMAGFRGTNISVGITATPGFERSKSGISYLFFPRRVSFWGRRCLVTLDETRTYVLLSAGSQELVIPTEWDDPKWIPSQSTLTFGKLFNKNPTQQHQHLRITTMHVHTV